PPPAKSGRGRRKATGTPETATPQHTQKELELIAKYPHQKGIIPGSYRVAVAEDRPGWGHKHTVLIRCCYPGGCEGSEPFVRATSDLQFTTTAYCSLHSRQIKANRRATAKAKKAL
ncbi:MAG: hypothetical protein ABGY75_16895, partial [Gemmataceae bacterium]